MDNKDAAPAYAEHLESHLEDDGKVHFDIPDDVSRVWRHLLAAGNKRTPAGADQSSSTPPSSPTIPRMNILMLVTGSRGDVQPFLVLAAAMTEYGHRVRIATHGVFREFVESEGIEFFDIGGSPVDLMAYMVRNPSLMPRFAAWYDGDVMRHRQTMKSMIHASWHACFEAAKRPRAIATRRASNSKKSSRKVEDPVPFVADAIIANPPSLAHIHCAEALGIPLHMLFTMPWTPTVHVSHPLASIKNSSKDKGPLNAMSYFLVDGLVWQGLGDIVNSFRNKTLQLDPIHPSRGPSLLHNSGIPHTYVWSPRLFPKPSDWPDRVAVTGYLCPSKQKDYSPPKALEAFLAAGLPPVYVGFGSIVIANPDKLFDSIIRAVHATGNRVILATGWSTFSNTGMSEDSYCPTKTFFLRQECPHTWLFPQVSCVIHHGGAGTTAASLRAGRPMIVVPFFGDQHFWGEQVARVGAGPGSIPQKEVTEDRIAGALHFALSSETLSCARAVGKDLNTERGAENAMENFHAQLPRSRMNCQLLPTHAAKWRHREHDFLLSAAAAAVLRKHQLIDYGQLELHRKIDLNVAHGPYDPVSGAGWAITQLFLESFRGMGEILAEVGSMPISTYRLICRPKRQGVPKVPPASHANDSSPAAFLPSEKRFMRPGEYFLNGSLRIGKAAVRAPGEFTAAMAHGSHALPQIWGDKSVRPLAKVTGVGSGMTEGCKELFWGVSDGISGLFMQPIMGLVKDGPAGFAKGAVSGILGLPVKFFSAASGIVGYPLRGIDLTISRSLRKETMADVRFQTILLGEYDAARLIEDEKSDIVAGWHQFVMQRQGVDSCN